MRSEAHPNEDDHKDRVGSRRLVINFHGKDVPVVGLRRRLAIQAEDESERRCILMADIDGQALGLIGRTPSPASFRFEQEM